MRSDREKGLVGMLAVIPEINLSVNVGKNVVGDKNFSPEKGKIRESEQRTRS